MVRLPRTSVQLSASAGGDPFVALLRARAELKTAAAAEANPMRARAIRRREKAVKRLANSATFGNFARTDRNRTGADGELTAFTDPWGGIFEARLGYTEQPGRWTFLPAASTVTAGSRLVIAMAERVVADAGGTVAAIHTDSLMVPASPDGGLWPCPGGPAATCDGGPAIRLLSWEQLDALLAGFDQLRTDGAPVWKWEHGTRDDPSRPLHVTVFGVNRYVVHDPATGEVVHNAESHLGGTLLDPTGGDDELADDGRRRWVAELTGTLIDNSRGLPEWARRPAVSMWRATTVDQLRWLRGLPGMADAQPFTSFLLAHPAAQPASAPSDSADGDGDDSADAARSPIAPYDPDPASWIGLPWHRRDGRPVRLVIADRRSEASAYPRGPNVVEVGTVADAADRWQTGGDFGALPISGDRSGHASGLYRRLPAEALPSPVLIGRDGDRLAESARGVIDRAERLSVLAEPGVFVGDVNAEVVRELVGRYRAELTAVLPERTLRAFLAGRDLQSGNAKRLLAGIDRLVFEQLFEAKVTGTLIDSPRSVRYETARRLLDGGAVVAANGEVRRRCTLPGCDKPRRVTYPYCTRDHQRRAAGLATARCGYPACEKHPASDGRFCSEAHRAATAKQRRRNTARGLDDPTPTLERIQPKQRTAPTVPSDDEHEELK